jgi:hypothetical protein
MEVRKSGFLWAIPVLITIFSLSLPAYAKYSGGTGEPNDPYQIATAEDLILLGETPEDYDKHFILTADIDLNPNLPGRKVFDRAVIPSFRGTFDGNNLTISHLRIEGGDYLGLFGQLSWGAEVKDMGVADVNITSSGNYVGGLVGYTKWECSVIQCYSSGAVSGRDQVGGLVGYTTVGCSVAQCYSSGAVSGGDQVGGLVGYISSECSMTQCYSSCAVSGGDEVGGLVGYTTLGCSVTQCHSTGSVTGVNHVGGLVGNNEVPVIFRGHVIFRDPEQFSPVFSWSTIYNCYSTAYVSGNTYVGGLLGSNWGDVTQCYSNAVVIGNSSVGGLAGSNRGDGTIARCYAICTIRKAFRQRQTDESIGGLVGTNFGTPGSGGTPPYPDIWPPSDPASVAVISDCYSIVSGDSQVSGLLVGKNGASKTVYPISPGRIVNCYATCDNSGTVEASGLVGRNYMIVLGLNCFWDAQVCGEYDNTNGGTPKTTAEMQTASTFLEAGWDFVGETENGTEDIWKIIEGLDYPFLSWQKYSGGTGDPNNPYKIATAEDLMLLGESPEDYDKHFIMIDDIDLNPNLPGRKVFDRAIIGNSVFFPFAGVFDGNGHVISNLNIQHSGQGLQFNSPINFGLFGQLQSEAEVKNLGVDDVNINISISDNDFYRVGGIVGVNFGNVTQCYSTGSVRGGKFVGGLVGNNSGDVTVCYSTCAVTGIRLPLEFAVWPMWPGERTVEEGEGGVGGLVGYNTGSIDMSYSTGAVSGNEYVGGLVGANGSYPTPKPIFLPVEPNLPLGLIFPVDPNFFVDPNFIVDPGIDPGFISGPIFPVDSNFFFLNSLGSIKNCYATGSVTGVNRFGGLVGQNIFGEIVASFWDIETSGVTSSNAGVGKRTAEMQTASTFLEAGWDFMDETENGTEDIWWIDEGRDYPRLWWERFTDDLFFLVVDDFENYNDLDEGEPGSNRIYLTWVDGFDTPEINGSIVGYSVGWGTLEHRIVHGGLASMPFSYDNAVGISEATASMDNLEIDPDWTVEGVRVLSLWFRGTSANAPEPMYVALANRNSSPEVAYHDNPNAAQIEKWTEWRIDLTRFAGQGVDLTNVNSITLGFGNRTNPVVGGAGIMYIDDIRLYRPTSEPAQ